MPLPPPLVDRFGRTHTNLRVSVTDRCNIRCFYCMPNEAIRFKPRSELLTFEEITRFVSVVARAGVRKIRLTGGEPLVRNDLPELIRLLSGVAPIEDIALTTNGLLLAEHAAALRAAGLNRLNISLDGLSEETFRRIARRDGLNRVLEGIDAALKVGFDRVRLNTVAIRGLTEEEVVPLAHFARERGLELRFIEFMPLDAEGGWQTDQVLEGEDIRRILAEQFGPLEPLPSEEAGQTAVVYAYADGRGNVGFIDPVSNPFCEQCNRLRITAEGAVRNCLFSTVEWDARALLRSDATDEAILALVRESIAEKKTGHGIDTPEFVKPERAMYQIGG